MKKIIYCAIPKIIDGFFEWIKYFLTRFLLREKKKWVNKMSEKLDTIEKITVIRRLMSFVTRHVVDSDFFARCRFAFVPNLHDE